MRRSGGPSDDDVDRLAALLGALPVVSTSSDVDALPAGVVGVRAPRIDDALLAHLAMRAPSIEYLESDGNSHVTDAGLSILPAFTRLKWLNLEWSAISDAGLVQLAGVSSLQWVEVGGSVGVTAAGVATLRKARPDLEVEAHGL